MTAYGDTATMTSYGDITNLVGPMVIHSLRDLVAIIRGRRTELRLSQSQLAARAGVSRQWISELERGKATAEIGLVLRVLDALDLRLAVDPRDGEHASADPAAIDLDALLDRHRAS